MIAQKIKKGDFSPQQFDIEVHRRTRSWSGS